MKRRFFLQVATATGLLIGWSSVPPSHGGADPQRIVVAGGDLTEIIFALDAGHRVIGVDQTSTWPESARQLPQIGYVRRLSAEGVLSLDPDLLIAAEDAGPDRVLRQLRAAGLPIAQAPETVRAGDVANKITFVGQVLGLEKEATALAQQYREDLNGVLAKVAALRQRPRVLFILSIQGNAPLVGGEATTADEMIRLAGGRNVGAAVNGYKPMGREAILALNPEVVLTMSGHANRHGGPEHLLARPDLAPTAAGVNGRIVTMDGLRLLGFGPRTPAAVAELARALHPMRQRQQGFDVMNVFLPQQLLSRRLLLGGLILAACLLALAGLGLGPVVIAPQRVVGTLLGDGSTVETAIIRAIRLPRLVLACAVGSALAVSGTALQGVLRNPLADPGLIGVTAGASLGAVAVIVLGETVAEGLPSHFLPWLLPAAAFLGASSVLAAVFAFSRRHGQTSVATLILVGVAMNAIAAAAIGILVYVSTDDQLRDLTFWTMGTLGSAGWPLVLVAIGLTALAMPLLLSEARSLDLFQLGERAAFHAGVGVECTKRRIMLATAVALGAVTAAAGPIGFIGLVAPHLARLMFGTRHEILLPAAMLLGICLTLAADLTVRLVVPPAEPPLGLATSLIGGPFFLWLLLGRQTELGHHNSHHAGGKRSGRA